MVRDGKAEKIVLGLRSLPVAVRKPVRMTMSLLTRHGSYTRSKFARAMGPFGALKPMMVREKREIERPNLDFPYRFQQAMIDVLTDEKYENVIAAFQEAFDYKRQFDTRAEKKLGLGYALKTALSGYASPRLIKIDSVKPDKPIDESFRNRIMGVVNDEQHGRYVVREFEHNIKFSAGLNPEDVSVDRLKYEIVSGLAYYAITKTHGVSEDPLH